MGLFETKLRLQSTRVVRNHPSKCVSYGLLAEENRMRTGRWMEGQSQQSHNAFLFAKRSFIYKKTCVKTAENCSGDHFLTPRNSIPAAATF